METIEQASTKIFPPIPAYNCAISEFKRGVKFATKWISVEDELPEFSFDLGRKTETGLKCTEEVIVKTRNDGMKICKRIFIKGKWIWPANYDVIEWRPIELK